MSWSEVTTKRTLTGKTYTDGIHNRFYSYSRSRLHYETTPGSGLFDAELDMSPIRVNNDNFDGWKITENGFHYALGKPSDKQTDGWVGFGGRGGEHWVKFRLAKVGYLHWPTRSWQDIGGEPTYNRDNLSNYVDTLTVGPEGAEQTVTVQSVATWANLWTTPGGGTLSSAWRAEGGRLKEEITINAAARELIAAKSPPTTPLDETWFGFVYQLDWSDIPAVVRGGIIQNIDGDFVDDGERIELQDALGRVLALMPLDSVTVPGADLVSESSAPLRKRFYRDGDTYYLLVGVRCDTLVGLPAGDLIFDPTFTDGHGGDATTYKDTFVISNNPTWNYGAVENLGIYRNSQKSLVEFDLSSIPDIATCDSATFYTYHYTAGAAAAWTAYVYSIAVGNAAWIEGTGVPDNPAAAGEPCWDALAADGAGGVTTAWAGSAGLSTSGTDYEAASLGDFSGDRSDVLGTEYSTTLTAARVEGWFGSPNTNYGILIWNNSATERVTSVCSSDHATTGYRPKLVVEYSLGGPTGIKTINDTAIASVKTINDTAIASVKTING